MAIKIKPGTIEVAGFVDSNGQPIAAIAMGLL
jgi:hypothetical protein